jgi:DNA-binding transcriptional LysR family regulator
LISKILTPLSRFSRDAKGHLRVDIGGSTARDVLIPLLPDFMQRYPDIRIDLGVADRPVDLISGNVDCVIRGGPLNDSTLIARHLGNAEMVTCATPGYLKNHGVPAYPQELRNGHKLISYLSRSPGGPFRFASDRMARRWKSAFHTISASMKAMPISLLPRRDLGLFRLLSIRQSTICRREH